MTTEEFAYWLQGWVEMEQGKRPNLQQWKMITAHLATIFTKVTPEWADLLLEDDVTNQGLASDVSEEHLKEIFQGSIDELNRELSLFEPPRAGRPPQLKPMQMEKICSTSSVDDDDGVGIC